MHSCFGITARSALAAFSLASFPASAAAMSWDPICGGTYWYEACDLMNGEECRRHNNWGQSVPCNLANPPYPGPGDDVEIGASAVVTLPGAAADIRSLNVHGQFTMTGHTLTIGTRAEVFPGGLFTVGAVTISGANPLAITGGESSRFEIANVGGFAGVQLWNTLLDNQGLTQWSAGQITTRDGSVIRNSRKLQILGSHSIAFAGGSPALFENKLFGEITKSGSAGETWIGIGFNNQGLVDVDEGTLTLGGGGVNSGVLDFESMATLHFQGGLYRLEFGTAVPGAGLVRVSIGTLSIDAPVVIRNAEQLSGIIEGSQTLHIDESFRWLAGTMQGIGVTHVSPGATLTVEGLSLRRLDTRTLDNDGDLRVKGSAAIEMLQGAVVSNDGDFEFEGDGNLTWSSSGPLPTFNNTGTLRKTGGSGFTTIAAGFTTGGTVEVGTGTLLVRNSHYVQTGGVTRLFGTVLRTTEGDVQIQGGLLTGSGTVHAPTLSNGGTVAPGNSAGSLTCTGNYTQSASGRLRIEIGGPAPTTQYDVLAVAGAATLAGTLEVDLLNGYLPPLGAEFDVVTAAGVSGAFSSVDCPVLPGGRKFETVYLSNRVRLRVVTVEVPATAPLPVALLALGLAAAAVTWRGRFTGAGQVRRRLHNRGAAAGIEPVEPVERNMKSHLFADRRTGPRHA